ncbi:MAG: hypothetical protein HQK79_15905 [Desulfobacterales bacterium]|nr:hypothetical protein [Desulfobacterales bacterium]MBF0396007.1 hypothetical protein [Desulfobacterales bacterium]
MISEKIKAFIAFINEDEREREELKQSLLKITEVMDGKAMTIEDKNTIEKMESRGLSQIIRLAKEKGFDFSAQDIKDFFQAQINSVQKSQELNMEQLDQIVGAGLESFICLSIFGFGVACAAVSVAGGAFYGTCERGFNAVNSW